MDHYKLYPGLATKIGAILVNVEQGLNTPLSQFGWIVLEAQLKDPDVQAWVEYLRTTGALKPA